MLPNKQKTAGFRHRTKVTLRIQFVSPDFSLEMILHEVFYDPPSTVSSSVRFEQPVFFNILRT